MNVGHLHGAELLKTARGVNPACQVSQAPAQSDMKTVGHKRDKDVCFDAMAKLMKNGAPSRMNGRRSMPKDVALSPSIPSAFPASQYIRMNDICKAPRN
jgi:hypothetical protein